MSWNDVGPVDLPDYFDIVVLLKAASADPKVTGYLFDDLYIPSSHTQVSGEYQVNIRTPNRNANFAGLSLASLFVRAGSNQTKPPSPAPEPEVLSLLGIGPFFDLPSRKRQKA